MNKTIALPDKKHSIPRSMWPFIRSLKNLEGIVRVGIGSFGNKSKYSEFQWKPQSTNPSTNTLKIKKTMRHLALKGEVCDRRSSFGCSRNDSILKDGVFFKFLDIVILSFIF